MVFVKWVSLGVVFLVREYFGSEVGVVVLFRVCVVVMGDWGGRLGFVFDC